MKILISLEVDGQTFFVKNRLLQSHLSLKPCVLLANLDLYQFIHGSFSVQSHDQVVWSLSRALFGLA